jgi:ribosomal protein S18 acetylase RimI-like enzyme
VHLPLVIERATTAECAELTELSVTTFVDSFGADNDPSDMALYLATEMNKEKLATELADTGNSFFIARLNGEAVGYIKLRGDTPEELQPARCVEIERIYVRKAYHDRKVGAALMQHAHDYAVAGNYEIIWLGVWEHNARAIAFYNRWGFTLFGSHIFRLGTDDQTDVLMKKTVTNTPNP